MRRSRRVAKSQSLKGASASAGSGEGDLGEEVRRREEETALAEAEYAIAMQPLRPKAKRVLYTIRIALNSVLDLRDGEHRCC